MGLAPHDPGGRIRLPLPPGVRGSAVFTQHERHRLELWRWRGPIDRYVLWVGMNPSTATREVDDPTVRLEWKRTERLGFATYAKANVISYRATRPRDLLVPDLELSDPNNLSTIRRLAQNAAVVVLTIGTLPNRIRHYADEVIDVLRGDGHELLCIGVNASGLPRHGRGARRELELIPYDVER